MRTVHLISMKIGKGIGREGMRWLVAAVAIAATTGGAGWRGAGAQQAVAGSQGGTEVARPQVQPAEAGSPTDPGPRQRIGLPVPKDSKLPTLFLVGDSTVRNLSLIHI